MREVVLYDENPSVRAIITRQLTQLGLSVVQIPALEETERVLQQCKRPFFLIIDLSRHADYLVQLQAFVSRYISSPQRCILTSVQPTSLARFLPSDVSSCFFQHVVERPFKMLDFISLIQDENSRMQSTVLTVAHSNLNSSVQQIISPKSEIIAAPEETKQVDDIVKSVSVSLEALTLDAGELNANEHRKEKQDLEKSVLPLEKQNPEQSFLPLVKQNPEKSVLPLKKQDPEQSFLPLVKQNPEKSVLPSLSPRPASALPTSLLTTAANNAASSSMFSRKHGTVSDHSNPPAGRAPRLRKDSAHLPVNEPDKSDNAGHATENPGLSSLPPSASRLGKHPSTTLNRVTISASRSAAQLNTVKPESQFNLPKAELKPVVTPTDDDFDDDHTMLVTQDLIQDALATPASPKLMPIQTGQMSPHVWVELIKRTCLTGKKLTLEIGNSPKNSIVIIHRGCAIWAETLNGPSPSSVHEFLSALHGATPDDIEKVENAIKNGKNLDDALSSLDCYNDLIPEFEKFISENIQNAVGMKTGGYRVYEGHSKLADALLKLRPTFSVPISNIIYDRYRQTQLDLGAYRFIKFQARPSRNLLNTSIKLSADEDRLMAILKTPQDLDKLKATPLPDALSMLPRLILFEFVDIVV